MKKSLIALSALALFAASMAHAGEKALNIASNTSGLSEEFSANIARTAVGMGVKEPLTLSNSVENGVRYAVVAGSTATVCKVKLSADAAPKIMGLSCK